MAVSPHCHNRPATGIGRVSQAEAAQAARFFRGEAFMNSPTKSAPSRRKFLLAAGVTGAAVAAPNVVKAQGPISMRWQSTWPSKDIFHEYALDYAKKVNDMTGGDIKIEVLPAGAVVPAF